MTRLTATSLAGSPHTCTCRRMARPTTPVARITSHNSGDSRVPYSQASTKDRADASSGAAYPARMNANARAAKRAKAGASASASDLTLRAGSFIRERSANRSPTAARIANVTTGK
jgi:hypothetical protein